MDTFIGHRCDILSELKKKDEKLREACEGMRYILVTDVGSTTTKARFFMKKGDEWRYVISGEAPTTVEKPYEDVTMGVLNAVREVEELTGHKLISKNNDSILQPYDGEKGVDLYCTTSSAGGGLQMMVGGVVGEITAASANRAVLGAGAIVMDILTMDDGIRPHEKITRIKNLRPDMILIAGGTDGGTVKHVANMAEIFYAAKPRPRLGEGYSLPIIYAGNVEVRNHIRKLFEEDFALLVIDNIRPTLNQERIEHARRAVHELFMEHVMSHAPGYLKLMKWTDIEIMPTPAGEGIAMQLLAKGYDANVLGVGLGGATTNVYSIFDGRFVRSVSANLGMSYSISNVLKETGIDNIMRWLPFDKDVGELQSEVKNKMIRPTTIPQTLDDLIVEHAVAREALRLGLEHHKTIATRLKGVTVERTVGDLLDQGLEDTYIDLMNVDVICGTGGLLSHAPKRVQSLLILTDAFQPEGITRMFQDSVFMMPHLGVLSTVDSTAAWQIFDKDCLVHLGTVIAPKGRSREGSEAMEIKLDMPDGTAREEKIRFGDIIRIPLGVDEEAHIEIDAKRGMDVGMGPGRDFITVVHGGVVGLVIDARGRPIIQPEDPEERKTKLQEWFRSLDMYD
jgi:uncharacterized protein (TIGR01319 family)